MLFIIIFNLAFTDQRFINIFTSFTCTKITTNAFGKISWGHANREIKAKVQVAFATCFLLAYFRAEMFWKEALVSQASNRGSAGKGDI